jgi:DNA-binding NarL/FixJ family response regulator
MPHDDTRESTPSLFSAAVSSDPIHVIVADDQTVARLGTCQVLSSHPEISVVAEATTKAEALQLARTHRPDVLVTEMVLPDGRGTEVVAALDGGRLPPTHVLILSAYRSREYLQAFLDSEAAGYLLKQDDPTHLVEAVRGIKQGTLGWFSTRVAGRLLALRRHEFTSNGLSLLTARERSLLAILARGRTNREIAAELDLSVGTVKNYLTGIYVKLKVDCRTKAIVWAHDHGLVGTP